MTPLSAGTSEGEQRLFAILQRLPDDWVAYYEPVNSDLYPEPRLNTAGTKRIGTSLLLVGGN
jgi:hypothetical protein